MGTRHLIAVVHKGEYKVAQYGQWDGNPAGQGDTVLDFLHSVSLDKFRKKLDTLVSWITPEEEKTVEATKDWAKVYPHLSRDAGAGVLEMIMDSDEPLTLQSTIGFVGDSLFCEYAYLLDLDNNILEFYNGFNKMPVTEGRFLSNDKTLDQPNNKEYHPVVLVKKYDFDSLPDVAGMEEDLEEFEKMRDLVDVVVIKEEE